MISPFNPMVNAMMASYQQAMSKGMPPDQAAVYVKSLAQQDVAPFVDLPAMLKQFEQLKRPKAQAPQTPNVREQIQMLANAKTDQGIGAIRPSARPVMPMNPMEQGIGNLNAGAMENPRGFNMGGIVAFSGEDGNQVVQSAPPVVAANLPKPRSTEDIYQYYANILGQGYVPAFKTQEKELEEIEKQQKIGSYAKSLEDEAELLKTQEKRSLEELMQDKKNLRRQEAADIAGAAVGSRSLLEAMAKARGTAVQRERELEKEIRAARNEREKAAIALTKAREGAVEKRTTAAMTRLDKAETRMIEAEKTLSDRKFALDEEALKQKNRLALAGFEATKRMGVAAFERETARQVAEAEARVKAGQGTSTDYVLGGQLLKKVNLEEQLRKETDPVKRKKLEQDIAAVTASIADITSAVVGTKARTGAAPIDLSQAQPAAGGAAPASQRSTASGTRYELLP